jgi:hypothetical protein
MLKRSPNGPDRILISFQDWTPDMMLLSSKLHMLPKPDCTDTAHEVGIDRLNNLHRGPEAIEALFYLSDDFKYCPTHDAVLKLGKVVIKANAELDALLAKRRRLGVGLQERRKKPAKVAPMRTSGPIRFRRGN